MTTLAQKWWAVPLMALLVVFPGCSKTDKSTPVQAPVTATTGSENKPLTPVDLRQRALSFMGKGDYDQAIVDWTRVVEQEPTADNWNDLSFAYLQAKRYAEAVAAGEKALALDREHPAALYNTGMAFLGSGQMISAASYLTHSAARQPDRYEPYLGAAHAYQATGQYTLAAYYAERAVALKAGNPEVKAVQAALKAETEGAPPADLSAASVAKLTDGAVTLYLYPDQGKNSSRLSLYAVFADGVTRRLPMLSPRPLEKATLEKAVLPNGVTGYWLNAGPTAIYVQGASIWLLFTRKDRDLSQVLFSNPPYAPTDTVISGGPPKLEGDTFSVFSHDGASGSTLQINRFQLSADGKAAHEIEAINSLEGRIETVIAEVITVVPRIHPEYKRTFTITGETKILRGDQSIPPSELKPGMGVDVNFAGNKAIEIHTY